MATTGKIAESPQTAVYFYLPTDELPLTGAVIEFLRMKSDAWGQTVLEGANLDLVVIFFAAGAVLIILHAVAAAWLKRRSRNGRIND